MEPNKLEEARSLFYLGLESQTQGRLAEAENLYLRSLSLVPDRPSILTNLYLVLIQQEKYEAAIVYIDKVLELSPEDAAAWFNKAVWLSNRQRFQEALSCCDRAIAIKPGYAEAHYNRGLVLGKLKRHEEALASLDQALAIKPGYAAALRHRGDVFNTLGRHEEARASYRAALACGGNTEELRYYLAALGADAAPAVSPPRLVAELFDKYAEVFDQHLTSLQYRGPQMLFDAVSAAAPAEGWDIADLGCGTGLCGPLFRPVARTLTGVDLSPNMIKKAHERKVYDRLIEGEIIEFLRSRAATFDLVIAADVFLYIGDLGPVFDGTRRALRRGGRFAFSVETHEGAGFVLQPSRHFAQSLPYLRECAAGHGFVETSVTRVTLRKENDQDIGGAIVVLRLRDS